MSRQGQRVEARITSEFQRIEGMAAEPRGGCRGEAPEGLLKKAGDLRARLESRQRQIDLQMQVTAQPPRVLLAGVRSIPVGARLMEMWGLVLVSPLVACRPGSAEERCSPASCTAWVLRQRHPGSPLDRLRRPRKPRNGAQGESSRRLLRGEAGRPKGSGGAAAGAASRCSGSGVVQRALRSSLVYVERLGETGPLLVPFGEYDEWSLRDRYNEAIRIMNTLGASEVVCKTWGQVTSRRRVAIRLRGNGPQVTQLRIENGGYDFKHHGAGSAPRDPRPLRWPDEPGFAAAVSSVLDNGANPGDH